MFWQFSKTDRKLNAYRVNMEEIIKIYKDRTFINSTEGGAMEGTKVQPFK